MAIGLVAIVLVGAGIWYATEAIAAKPLQVNGGGITGTGVHLVDDAYHVPCTNGGTVDVVVFINNEGHYRVSIIEIAFTGVAPRNDLISPIQSATPLKGSLRDAAQLGEFQPFTFDALQSAVIGWHLTMCPAASNNNNVSYGYDMGLCDLLIRWMDAHR